MKLSRRQLLRWITASGAGVVLAESVSGLSSALAAKKIPPTLVWLNDGGDDLNLLTLLGHRAPRFLELVTTQWDMYDHDGMMPTTYDPGDGKPAGAPVVVVARIPENATLLQDSKSPAAKALKMLLEQARVVLLVGTEACYGGMGTDQADVSAFDALCKQARTPVIRLPGIPVPPHHLVGVLAYLEFFGFPELDSHGRPLLYYNRTVCEGCERRSDLEQGRYATAFGVSGCLLRLGCKGPVAHNTCSVTRWNHGENWCVGAGGPCTGCSEPGFPDHGGVGLYGPLSGHLPMRAPAAWGGMERFGYGLLGLAGAGYLLQTVRRLVFPDPKEEQAGKVSLREHQDANVGEGR